MLQRQQLNLSDTRVHAFISIEKSYMDLFADVKAIAAGDFVLSSAENSEPKTDDAELEDAARSERNYVRERLRGELKREPTEQEVDEWLRQHTEGY
jgi:hypothetical protein